MSFKLPKRVKALIMFLLILITPLLISSLVSGGKIANYSLSENLIDQNLKIKYSTNLASVESLEIKPEIKTEFSVSSNELKIDFLEPLRYNTKYTVNVVSTDSRSKTSKQKLDFETQNPEIYHLKRSNELDTIYLTKLNSETEEVFQAKNIVTYSLSMNKLAVITRNIENGELYVNNDGQEIIIPEIVSQVRSFEGSSILNEYLLVVQLEDSSHRTYKLTNNELEEILYKNIEEAYYAADQKSIIYKDSENNFFLVDNSLEKSPLSIENLDKLIRIFPNGSGYYTINDNAYSTITSFDANKTQSPNELQSLPFVIQTSNLDLYYAVQLDFVNDDLMYKISTYKDNQGFSEIYSLNQNDVLYDLHLSPNDEFLLASLSPKPQIFDNITPHWQPENQPSTLILDKTGNIITEIEGSLVRWNL